jgi:hypothetical protein
MTAMKSDSMVCMVCRKQLANSEDYLVRMRNGRATTVHRHLCFPPAQQPATRPAGQTAA